MGVTSLAASAEIHRCKDERGQTVLSDRPCGAAFSGDPLRSSAQGSGAERISAAEMRTGRSQDGESQYSFIGEHVERSARRQASK
jgi:hypothetical protein